jgi:hypothetical protein
MTIRNMTMNPIPAEDVERCDLLNGAAHRPPDGVPLDMGAVQFCNAGPVPFQACRHGTLYVYS